MNYGKIIEDFKVEHKFIHEKFNEYYQSPTLLKIKDVNNFSMYMNKLYCLLSKECRYIVAFVDIDPNPIGFETKLIDLNWVSFQTRTIDSSEYTGFKFKYHSYEAVGRGELLAEIVRTEITDEASIYRCEKLNLIVTLLHTEKNTKEVYQPSGNVISALETFQTIITFE